MPAEKAEEFLLYYIQLRYRLLCGGISKITHHLVMKANELGFSRATAFNLIRIGKEIGMVEEC